MAVSRDVARPHASSLESGMRRRKGGAAGFSLVELLVVIAILAVLGVASGPALQGMLNARNSARMGAEVMGCLEMARSEALARNTFVWVGFTNQVEAGTPILLVGMASSRDGTTNSAATNLAPLQKVLKIQHARAASDEQAHESGGSIPSLATNLSGGATKVNPLGTRAGERTGLSSLAIGPVTLSNTITFTPQGEVLLAGTPGRRSSLDPFLLIYLQRMEGDRPSQDLSAVLVNGASGIPQLIQLR